MTTEDKINSLEYFCKIHFTSYQLVECGLLEYFRMLRNNENSEFLNELHTTSDLKEYSYVVRDTHQKKIN